MANVGASADANVNVGGLGDLFNLSSAAGWAMFWWWLSVAIILLMLISL